MNTEKYLSFAQWACTATLIESSALVEVTSHDICLLIYLDFKYAGPFALRIYVYRIGTLV